MGQHSDIGPSICERYWNCPGSITLFGHLKSEATFYATQGTAAHQVAEEHLFSLRQLELSGNDGAAIEEAKLYQDRLGEIITVEEDGKIFQHEVTVDMLQAVGEYVDLIQQLIEEHDIPWEQAHFEVRFDLTHIDDDLFGTADAMLAALHKGTLFVVDYKHGAGVSVEIQDNKQTLCYGLGAYYKLTPEERKLVKRVETIISQPRCPHSDGTIRRAVYDVQELLEWEAGLVAAVGRVRNGDKTLMAGSHCKFCPGKPHCPEAKNEVARLAMVDFQDIDIPSGPPDVKTLTPEQIAHLLQFIPFIKDWCDSLLAHAHTVAETGTEIPGYKLADKRANRRWKPGAEDELEFILGERMYADRKIISPAEAEKRLPKASRNVLADLWEKPEPGKTLVKVDDDRDARLPSAIADFIDIDI